MGMRSNRSNLSRRDFLATTAASVTAAGMIGAGCMEQNKRDTKTLAVCGLDCAACPAFIAYQTDDEALRTKTAGEWSKQFGLDIKPADVNCVSCLKTDGPHIGHCAECEIRKCGLARNVKNCALCDEYPCDTIGKFLANVPPAQANLDEVRRTHRR
jgi:hypothetical protein